MTEHQKKSIPSSTFEPRKITYSEIVASSIKRKEEKKNEQPACANILPIRSDPPKDEYPLAPFLEDDIFYY